MNAKELGNIPAYPIESEDAMSIGMTIRQRYAMAAMQGLMANINVVAHSAAAGWALANCTTADVAHFCLKQADALLAESLKESP